MPARKHIVITGPGRCGTTFLVKLLTHLGLDTGFQVGALERLTDPDAQAGLEHDIRLEGCPRIVKSPWFCDHAPEVLGRDDIVIEHLFLLVRDLDAAAESRRRVQRKALARLSFVQRLQLRWRPVAFPGGLWHTRSSKAGDQEAVLLERVYGLLCAVADRDIPVTLVRYPRSVQDPQYLHRKLQPILAGMGFDAFHAVFQEVLRPEQVHSYNGRDV